MTVDGKRLSKRYFDTDFDRIRAHYGHTVPGRIKRTPAAPPAVLYHGTAPDAVSAIMEVGLIPMSRQYVHLSPDRQQAVWVGKRKAREPVILVVRARDAYEAERGVLRRQCEGVAGRSRAADVLGSIGVTTATASCLAY